MSPVPFDAECNCCNGVDEDQDGDIDGQDSDCPTTASIVTNVFSDQNNDGVSNASEPGVAGVTIQLFGDQQDLLVDIPIATAVSDANGDVTFSGLVECGYVMYIPNPPAGTSSSGPNVTSYGDDGVDDNDNGLQNDTDSDNIFDGPIISIYFGLAAGQSKTTIDFGLVPSCVGWIECDCNDGIDNDNNTLTDCLDSQVCICPGQDD